MGYKGNRPFILHLSGDFPDPVSSDKTPVIETLLKLTASEFDHHVVSINRSELKPLAALALVLGGKTRTAIAIDDRAFEYGTALSYSAPGRGLFHKTYLEALGNWLGDYIAMLPRRPQLLVGHKLTIEGIAIAQAAARSGIPYAISIQGNTDTKILNYRPDLSEHFASIFHGAAGVFPFTPWALKGVEAELGKRNGNVWLLPCPTSLDVCIPPKTDGERFISVFHLRNHKVKNLDRLVSAFRGLDSHKERFSLDVIGGGTRAEVEECEKIVGQAHDVNLIGARSQDELRPIMHGAIAMVMPSRRESFGLAFIEALQSGCPIIYPRGAAIDGFFDGAPFAIGVDASSVSEIRQAIETAEANEVELKAALKEWQDAKGYEQFTRPVIAKTFTNGLNVMLGRETSPAN